MGLVFNIDPKEIGVVLLDPSEHLQVGTEVQRTKRVLDVPVGDGLLGRVVDPLGRPLDGLGEVNTVMRSARGETRAGGYGPLSGCRSAADGYQSD